MSENSWESKTQLVGHRKQWFCSICDPFGADVMVAVAKLMQVDVV